MSKLAQQWIELFRAGKYPQGEFTTADIDQVVANYKPSNPEFEEAPSTIGHPTGEAPAWAWWEGLKREGNVLMGKMKDVRPEFEDMVLNRQFPKRSIGLVKRAASGWNLEHVAFLGAKAPQIKGLKDVSFASDAGVVKVEFEENSRMQNESEATGIASLKAWFEEKFGTRTVVPASVTFTEADVTRIAGQAVSNAVAAAVAPLQAELATVKSTFAARETALATVETRTRAAEAVNKLKASGKWVPAFEKMGLVQIFEQLAPVTTVVEFGEGAEKVSKTPFDLFVTFMESIPKIVPGGVTFTGQQSAAVASGMRGVNGGKLGINENSVRFHEAVVAYQETAKVDYLTAAAYVERKFPNLTLPGGSAAGQV